MRTKLIVFITVVGLGIVGAFGWLGYQLFTTGFSAKTEPPCDRGVHGASDPSSGHPDRAAKRAESHPVESRRDERSRWHILPITAPPAMPTTAAARHPSARTSTRKRRTYDWPTPSRCRTVKSSGSFITAFASPRCRPGERVTRRRQGQLEAGPLHSPSPTTDAGRTRPDEGAQSQDEERPGRRSRLRPVPTGRRRGGSTDR